MSWFQVSANETEAAKEHVCMFIAVQFQFQSATLRFWTGWGTIQFNGFDWIGAGDLGKIDSHSEHIQLVAERKTYQLSGVDPALVLESDVDSSFGRTVTEYLGFIREDGQLVAQPEINWEGRIDSFNRSFGSQPIIEVHAEHRLALLEKADGWRYTHEHQQIFFPGDDGLKQVASIEMMEIHWGGKPVAPGVTGPPGGQDTGGRR